MISLKHCLITYEIVVHYHHCPGTVLVYTLPVIHVYPSAELAVFLFSIQQKVYTFNMTKYCKSNIFLSDVQFSSVCVHVFPSRLENQQEKIKIIQSVCLLKVLLFYIWFNLSQATYIHKKIISILFLSSAKANDGNKQLHSHFLKNKQYWLVTYFGQLKRNFIYHLQQNTVSGSKLIGTRKKQNVYPTV